EFPDDARCRADELGLPIVSLPGPLAWSDLIGRVFADGDRQSSQAAHLSAIYRGFSQHRARLGSLRELFDLVTGFVNLPVVLAVEDEMGLRIESRGVSSAEAEGLAETLIYGEATGTHPQDTPLRLTVGSETVAVARTGKSANGGRLVAIVKRAQTATDADIASLT